MSVLLDEIQKHSKSLSHIGLKDLFVALIGDPAKSNVLERSNQVLKSTNVSAERPHPSTSYYERPSSPMSFCERPSPLMRYEYSDAPLVSLRPFSRRTVGRNPVPYRRSSPYGQRPNFNRLLCFFCESDQHLIRNCPAKSPNNLRSFYSIYWRPNFNRRLQCFHCELIQYLIKGQEAVLTICFLFY